MIYAIQVLLMDPLKLKRQQGDVLTEEDPAIVMMINGLVEGDFAALPMKNAREASRVINRGIVELEHRKRYREQLGRRQTDLTHGFAILHYCSRCGGRFAPTQCPTCKISFDVNPCMLLGKIPIIPAKIVRYAKAHRHRFTLEPPSA